MQLALCRSIAMLSLASPALAFSGHVVIAGNPSAGVFPNIHTALTVARPGDVLLVGTGTYNAFTIDGAGVWIFAMPGAQVSVKAPVVVRNVPAHESVVLSGLRTLPVSYSGMNAIELRDNVGFVGIQSCQWIADATSNASGHNGVDVSNCGRVAIVDSRADGGWGHKTSTCSAINGGMGLKSAGSVLAIYGSEFNGGAPNSSYRGGHGGFGIASLGDLLFAGGNLLTGHAGGNVSSCNGAFCPGEAGNGGDGLYATGSSLTLLPNEYFRGAGGDAPACGYAGIDGFALRTDVPAMTSDAPLRIVQTPLLQIDDVPQTFTAFGAPADRMSLVESRTPTWEYGAAAVGPWIALPGPGRSLGTVHASGSIAGALRPMPNAPGESVRKVTQQLVVVDASHQRLNMSPRFVLVFDDQLGEDCNGNGSPDPIDIATATSLDTDGDGRPDECP